MDIFSKFRRLVPLLTFIHIIFRRSLQDAVVFKRKKIVFRYSIYHDALKWAGFLFLNRLLPEYHYFMLKMEWVVTRSKYGKIRYS